MTKLKLRFQETIDAKMPLRAKNLDLKATHDAQLNALNEALEQAKAEANKSREELDAVRAQLQALEQLEALSDGSGE